MVQEPRQPTSPLARALREYRERFKVTQTQLASDLNVDVKTIGRWEREETTLSDVRELSRLASMLGIEPEQLGVVSSIYVPLTYEQVDETIDHIWNLARQSRYFEASPLVERFLQGLIPQIKTDDHAMLNRLARGYHIAGHVTSILCRTSETDIALRHYYEMEQVARTIQDDTLLNLALTYEGDMYRRKGDLSNAIKYLQAACDTTPHANNAARGNAIQLLGRAYVQAGNKSGFERAMAEAEDLTYQISAEETASIVHGLYNLGTVYEDYNRSYTILGETQKALEYLEKAEKALRPITIHWQTLLATARAATLVQAGDITAGVDVAIEATHLCLSTGNYRLLERIYAIQSTIESLTRTMDQANSRLREALSGPVEY
ncbi:helix-turn-helix domain-containing protein [Ktedonosporobacter rubrisoli]|uniref:Helix-turn-helix domain-containing protein n=1 Tax=Ktedonosporobacter rubrisoli TaxID=2509675 RepID=A0A4P6JU56_KTERU|nr:helix-turn-helix transcriptional regulator [Ktedonosporobacter rubrisoli]QBD78822.1 helix-turn-helix domain-containing protein [Ktedonosporobacter rubrisoli]